MIWVRYHARVRLALLMVTTFLSFSACRRDIPRGFDSPEPAARLDAILAAARTREDSAVPDLVRMLASDDPAVRLAAIGALERITGQTLGYHHGGPQPERDAAIDRWVEWVRVRGADTALPSTEAGDPVP